MSPKGAPDPNVTRLLQDWSSGDRSALGKLTPLIYDELRRLARNFLRRERPDHTLQPTALVNEAYVRLSGDVKLEWQSRAHFFGIAAKVMRRILVQHARGHIAGKRGGGAGKLSLDDVVVASDSRPADLVALDEALAELEALDSRKARVIELRYFGGLTAEEMVDIVGISTATITRELRVAHAWLQTRLQQ